MPLRMTRVFTSTIGILTLAFVAGLTAADRTALSREELRRMALETQLAIEYIEQQHYSRIPFESVDSAELIKSYMRELDHARLFFFESDREEFLLRFSETLKPVYLSKGELYPAFEIFDVYKQRAMDRFEWITERLKSDFDLTTDRSYVPDRSKLPWPADRAEADDLWERRLHFEVLQERLAGDTHEDALEKLERRYQRSKRIIEDIEPHNVQETFLTALTNLYDPHSTFFSVEAADEFSIAISQSLSGIGAVLRDEDGYCVVQELIPGGPADMSGQLEPGDKIIAVAQGAAPPEDVVDLRLRRIVQKIRGAKGTEVRLTIIPAAAGDPAARKVVTLVRDEIKLTENLARANIIEVPRGEDQMASFGVIELPSFYGVSARGEVGPTTTDDVAQLIEKLVARGVQGIVLDLRRNGGGLLSEAIRLTGLFIPKGPVVMVRDGDGQVRSDWDRDGKLTYEGPLVVLTSRNSASASEIVAGALRSHRRALIVGDSSTHGKGTVQTTYDLNRSLRGFLNQNQRLGTIKLTIQKFYLPDGSSTQKEGVPSDIVIPSVNEFLPIGESDLENVMDWDQIQPADWNVAEARLPGGDLLSGELIELLRQRSEKRMDELDEFALLEQHIEWFRARQELEEFSLNLEKRQEQRNQDEEFRDAYEAERDRLRRSVLWEEVDVLLDLAEERRNQQQEKILSTELPDGRSRINQYYQRVFYYRPAEDQPVEEIQVTRIDYEKGLRNLEEFRDILSAKIGSQIPSEALEAAITDLKNADYLSEFHPEEILAEHLKEHIGETDINTVVSAFYLQMLEYDPTARPEAPVLDIPLRESLRILGDWNHFLDNGLGPSSVAQRRLQKEKAPSAPTD